MGTVSVMMWYRGNGGRWLLQKKKNPTKKTQTRKYKKKSSFFLLTQNRDGVGLFHWWGLI